MIFFAAAVEPAKQLQFGGAKVTGGEVGFDAGRVVSRKAATISH
jgi:hypothetical protein